MEYIVEVYRKEEIKLCKEHHADGIIIPLAFYSLHSEEVFAIEDLKELVSLANGLAVYLDVTRMFEDTEWDQAREIIKLGLELGVSGFYFSDLGFLSVAREFKAEMKCFYQPETMIVNSLDASVFLEMMGGICLAKELTLDELVKISSYNNGNVEVFIHGRPLMSMSKRPHIKNYLEEINYQGEVKKIYTLKEELRMEEFPVLTNEQGTFYFATYTLDSFKEIAALNEVKTKRGRLSHFLLSSEEMFEALAMYKSIEINGYDEDKANSFRASHSSSHYHSGFYYQKTSVKKED